MHHHEEEEYVSAEEYSCVLRAYWRVVEESEGFDIEDVSIPPYMAGKITGLIPYNCIGCDHYPFRGLVKLYASVGLHRYNMLEGTNFQLGSLIKFNMTQNCVCSYFMTLVAREPDAGPMVRTFQVRIDEQRYGSLDFTCSIARLKKETRDEVTDEEPFIPHFHGGPPADGIFKGELPDWPSDADLNDGDRFYVVKESEWQGTDWISMYLKLVICSHDRFILTENLAGLTIVNVAIETCIEDAEPQKRLNAKSANVYITFRGLAAPRAGRQTFEYGDHVERRAIIRRVISERTGKMSLLGKLCGSENTEEQKRSMTCRSGAKAKSSKKRLRLG